MRAGRSGRRKFPRAEAILAEGKADFARWQAARTVTPIISAMRDEAERIRAAELHRFLQRDGSDTADAARLDALTKSIVNKLLHHPTVRLKEMSATPDYATVAGDLFGVAPLLPKHKFYKGKNLVLKDAIAQKGETEQ